MLNSQSLALPTKNIAYKKSKYSCKLKYNIFVLNKNGILFNHLKLLLCLKKL